MTTVTVDLDDLTTIVMATGVIKLIEGVLVSYKKDPFVHAHLDYSAAHDRLAAVMRNAARAEAGTATDWDGELTKDEIKFLKIVDNAPNGLLISSDYRLSKENKHVDTLAAKGCIQLGQLVSGAIWPGAKLPEFVTNPKGYAVRMTDRGRQKLHEATLKVVGEVK